MWDFERNLVGNARMKSILDNCKDLRMIFGSMVSGILGNSRIGLQIGGFWLE